MKKSAPAHWRHKPETDEDPTRKDMHIDDCFLRQEDEGDTITVLVVIFRKQRLTFAHVVPGKGADIPSAVNRLVDDLKSI